MESDCKKCKKLLIAKDDDSGYKPYPVPHYRCADIGRDILDLTGDCKHFEPRGD